MYTKQHYQSIAETIGRLGNILGDEALITISNEFDCTFRAGENNYQSSRFYDEVEKQVNRKRKEMNRIEIFSF